jgi:hypothetical protein
MRGGSGEAAMNRVLAFLIGIVVGVVAWQVAVGNSGGVSGQVQVANGIVVGGIAWITANILLKRVHPPTTWT